MTINLDSFRRHMARLGRWRITSDGTYVIAESEGRAVVIDMDTETIEAFVGASGIMRRYDPELIAGEITELVDEMLEDIGAISR